MAKKEKKEQKPRKSAPKAESGKKGKGRGDEAGPHTGYRFPEGDPRCQQYGPEENGFMTIGPTGPGVVVWVGDATKPGWSGWPVTTNPVEYWWFDGPAFPQVDFDQFSGTGSPPAYGSRAWLRFPLLSWDAGTIQPNGLLIDVDANDSFYRITATVGGAASPGTFWLQAIRGANGALQKLRWVATGLAANQQSLFPPGTPWAGRKLHFDVLGAGNYSFDPGVRAFQVSPL